MASAGSTQPEQPPAFERIEEYQAVLSNLSDWSQGRQNTSTVYIGLNTVFLTALGVFLSTHLDLKNWNTAIAVGVITVAILPLNLLWRWSHTRYGRNTTFRYKYLADYFIMLYPLVTAGIIVLTVLVHNGVIAPFTV